MDRAVDSLVLMRAFELALRLEGLKPHTVQTYHRYAVMFTDSCGLPLPVASRRLLVQRKILQRNLGS